MKRTILILALLLANACTSSDYYRSKLPSILGTEAQVEEDLHYYDQWGVANADGYTLAVFTLTRETIDRFLRYQAELKYPYNLGREGDWTTMEWTKGPLPPEFDEIRSMILFHFTDDPTQKDVLKEVEQLLASDAIYYAALYRGNREQPNDVLFYLLDPSKATIFIFDIAV